MRLNVQPNQTYMLDLLRKYLKDQEFWNNNFIDFCDMCVRACVRACLFVRH